MTARVMTLQKKIFYSYHSSLLGNVFIANTSEGICFVSFAEDQNFALKELKRRFAKQEFLNQVEPSHLLVVEIINGDKKEKDIRLDVFGTDFQKKVWKVLLEIPYGHTSTYSSIAAQIGIPKGYRAVGNAISQNPIAILIPCHRIIRSSNELGGFKWGIEMKKRLLEREKVS